MLLMLFVLNPLCIPMPVAPEMVAATPRRDCVEDGFFFKNGEGRFSSSSMFQRVPVSPVVIVGTGTFAPLDEAEYADMAVSDPALLSCGGAVLVRPGAPGRFEGEGPIVAIDADELLRFVGPSAALLLDGRLIMYWAC